MRIPPSLVVMSLLTATPFALGIRDVVLHRQPADELASAGEREERREREQLERIEAQAHQEAEQAAVTHRANLLRIATLYGPHPASLGGVFGDATLGAQRGFSDSTRAALAKAEADGVFQAYPVFSETGVLEALRIEIADHAGGDEPATCDSLREGLGKAWGPSTNRVWLDAEHGLRASLSEDACQLAFERALPVAAWVTQVLTHATALPVPGADRAEDGEIASAIDGVGYGEGPTAITTYVDDKGKRIAVRIGASTDFTTLVQIRDALSQMLHQQPMAAEGDLSAWTWKKAPGYVLEEDGENHFSLVIGKDPTL